MRLRNFGVTGGTLRKGSLDPCAKGQETFTQTAAGEPKRGYRKIVQVLQENPFGPTVKSLRGYREIA